MVASRRCEPKLTVTFSPGLALPQIGRLRSRCRTAPSVKSGASVTSARTQPAARTKTHRRAVRTIVVIEEPPYAAGALFRARTMQTPPVRHRLLSVGHVPTPLRHHYALPSRRHCDSTPFRFGRTALVEAFRRGFNPEGTFAALPAGARRTQ